MTGRTDGQSRAHRWHRVNRALAWLTLLVALTFVAARYGPGQVRDEILYNADATFIPVLFGDLIARGTLAGWDLPTSPFIFPDMALFFPLLAVLPNLRIATLLFGLLQLLLLCIGVLWLHRQLFPNNRPTRTWAMLALTLLLWCIGTGFQVAFPYAYVSVHHMGVLVVLPFATLALLRALHRPRTLALLLLYALTIVTTLSDTLYIIQFVLPALGALLLWGKQDGVSWRTRSLIAIGLLLTTAAGHWLRGYLVPPEKLLLYARLDPAAMATAWANLRTWLIALVQTDALFVILWPIGSAALIIAALGKTASRALALVATLALASMGLSVAAVIVSGNFIDTYSTRYILPTLYLPLLLGLPLCLPAWLTQWRASRSLAMATNLTTTTATLAATAYLLITMPALTPISLATFAAHKDPFVACLLRETAQRQLRYGLAGFWEAGRITALAEGALEVVATDRDLAPILWNNNPHRYAAPFEFIIIDGSMAATADSTLDDTRYPDSVDAPAAGRFDRIYITQRFGPPHDEFTCAGNRVLVYNHPADALSRHWFSHHPTLAQLHQVGEQAEFYGYTLASNIGAMPVGLSIGASEQWDQDEGTLAHAPLKQLSPGRYAVRIDLFADHAHAGVWEVVAITNTGRDLRHVAPITDAGVSVTTGHFDLKTTADVDVVVKYNGRDALYVDRIQVARLETGQSAAFTFADQPAPDAATPGALHLLYPPPGSIADHHRLDFVWQWTGPPLPSNETFEVRLWRTGDSVHFGAHDAQATHATMRRIGDTYMLRLDLRGAHTFMQHGAGEYQWTVARVAISPTYQDLQYEAAPFTLTVQP